MKTIIIILFSFLFAFSANAESNKWTTQNTLLEVTGQTLRLIDFSQTLQIARQPERYSEINPIMGKHPSTEKVCVYFVTYMIGSFAISYFLPEPYRTAWQSINIVLQFPVIAHNFNVGLGIRF